MKLWTNEDGRTMEPAYSISSPRASGSGELNSARQSFISNKDGNQTGKTIEQIKFPFLFSYNLPIFKVDTISEYFSI